MQLLGSLNVPPCIRQHPPSFTLCPLSLHSKSATIWSAVTRAEINAADALQGSQLRALRTLVGATVLMTGVMVLTKAFVDERIPRPPPKPGKQKSVKKKKKHGSFSESLQVGCCDHLHSSR